SFGSRPPACSPLSPPTGRSSDLTVGLEDQGRWIRRRTQHADEFGLQAGGVAVVQHGEHARHVQYGSGLDGADAAAGDGGQHEPAVGEADEGHLTRVAGGAGDLVPALDAGVRCADGRRRTRGAGRGGGHRAASSASSDSTATTRLRMSVTLYPLRGSGSAAASSASAAAAKYSASAGAPLRTRSA